MKLYNTLTRKIEDFKPLDPENVKIYTCGPTVYSRAHIGNLFSYVCWDLLVRTLEAEGYTVKRVLNLTDVGHLTSDGDEGEDKLEKGAKREGKTVWEVADYYIKLFKQDFESLRLKEPSVTARATDYITEGEELVDKLTNKGYTYETEDGIYFDTSRFPHYAELGRLDLDHLRAGARVEFNSEKRHISDFALWKFIQEGEDHAMRWDYLDRPGYPGWHLECSTIAHTELGETLDIHTGGVDHIPVHHTNEIAQSEAAYGKKFVNYWAHCNFINIDGTKISKSLGNVYSLDDLREKGYDPLDFKLWVLQGHYRGERNFTFEGLEAAKNRRLAWKNRVALAYQEEVEGDSEFREKFLGCLSDNLNSPEALALIDGTELSREDWEFVEGIFQLDLLVPEITEEQKELIYRREEARTAKDFAEADRLRDELAAVGLTVLDTPEGPRWQLLG